MADEASVTDWQTESKFYDRRHPRLVKMAEMIAALPHRKVLDVGCAVGMMGKLLPPGFDYFGCDLTDHAEKQLAAGHFQQIDLNATHDLSYFAGKGIRTVNISGVLEYVKDPASLLHSLHELVGTGGGLVLSMVNFEATRYADPVTHHAAWQYKPQLEELRSLLREQKWRVTEELGYIGDMGWRTRFYRWLLKRRGADHPWTRKFAWLFLLTAEAI